MNKALSELEISLKVGLGVLHGLLVDLAGASSDHVGRLGDDIVSLAGSFEEAVVSFTGLFDALAGKVAHGRGNFEIHLLAHSGLLSCGFHPQTLDGHITSSTIYHIGPILLQCNKNVCALHHFLEKNTAA